MCKTLRQDLSSPKKEIKLVKKTRATKLQKQNAFRKAIIVVKRLYISGTKNLEFKEFNFNAQKANGQILKAFNRKNIYILYLVFTLPL
jgi:hypothetical protein